MREQMWRMIIAGLFCLPCAWAQDAAPKKLPPVTRQLSAVERQKLSVERQLQAIQRNYSPPFAESSGVVIASAPPPECPPTSAAEVKPIIDREATRQKLDARLVQAVVEAESAYSPCAVSPVGAMGLMQLMPSTAESLQVSDPFDPSQNITAGTQYLKQMLDRYGGDIAKALAAYNAGPARVDAAGGIPSIPETQEYVRKIMGKITPPRPVE